MKAFVIKNKEGKYFCGFDYFPDINIFSENIIDGIKASTYEYCQKEIEDFDLKDCEVVEITIAEGDLETKLRICNEALGLAILDGNEKIFDTYCIADGYYYGDIPSMRYKKDYIKEAEGYIKEVKEEE